MTLTKKKTLVHDGAHKKNPEFMMALTKMGTSSWWRSMKTLPQTQWRCQWLAPWWTEREKVKKRTPCWGSPNSTTTKLPWRFAGSRLKTCCGRLAGCACRRPENGITSIQKHFSGNFSSISGQNVYFNFIKCKLDNCKIKCKDNNMVLPLNNFKSSVNGRHYSILTDSMLDCNSYNIVYLITCNVCKVQYVGETQRAFGLRMREHLNHIRKDTWKRSGKKRAGYFKASYF